LQKIISTLKAQPKYMSLYRPLCNRIGCLQLFRLFVALMVPSIYLSAQSTVIPLYPGTAPGSETWNWEEGETTNTPIKFRIAYNVSKPTLTVYRPDTANGAAVMVIPGGGLYVINVEHEGHNVATQLVKNGVTVFVLKYRTGRIASADPWGEMLHNSKDTALNRLKLEEVRPLVRADALAAIRYIRSHAGDYRLDPKKIGILGFSVGGGMALRLCTSNERDTRPDFAGLIYTVYRPAAGDTLPATVPPAFIACASDDALAPPGNSTALYSAWLKARQPAELHIYAKGGHGLRGSAAAQGWLKRFEEWMREIGMIK
jgi:acetyl esterase/lipase